MGDYDAFLERKRQLGGRHGFDPIWMPNWLHGFQQRLTEWNTQMGRSATFADCGLGKTPMQLVWGENVRRQTGKPVLIATPLAVSYQTIKESEKFGIDSVRSQDGDASGGHIVVTNYERLGAFNPQDFGGMVCDESSILKNFNGIRRAEITAFMRKMRYRLLCTATAAPNDYHELGTSSEALGELGYMDMLGRFFKNQQGNCSTKTSRTNSSDTSTGWERVKWRLKGHAHEDFWRWVSSWARACRRPSDLGFDDDGFILPDLIENEHVVKAKTKRDGFLFDLPAETMREERQERRRTIGERCEKVAELVDHTDQALVWCHLNGESDRLASMIRDAEQVKGSDSDDDKESRLLAFQKGNLRVLVTKPKIAAFGLNLQGCAHITFFPSHSYEQYYQGVRRCWRFGQTRPVVVDVVTTDGERGIADNLKRKARQADAMFSSLVRHMNDSMRIDSYREFTNQVEVPSWL